MDRSQLIIFNEIKALEDKFKDGNKSKVNMGLLVGMGVAAVGTIASVLYTPETLIQAIPLEPLAQLLIGNTSLALLAGGGGYFFTKGKKETSAALEKAYISRIEKLLEKIQNARPVDKVDFIFNFESSIYPTYQKKSEAILRFDANEKPFHKDILQAEAREKRILPENIADNIKSINKVFRELFSRDVVERPLIETINISNSELNDKQLNELLSAGLGCCGTTNLILSKNRLNSRAIKNLKKYIVERKTAFQNLKTLDLSYNNLSEDALEDLACIVKILGIEQLDLSGNSLNSDGGKENANYISVKLKNFLMNQANFMPSLKVLKLADVNLTDNFSKSLNLMLVKPSILTHLDITNNPHLSARKLRRLFEKGYQINQSVKELLVDGKESLFVTDIEKSKDELYERFKKLPDQVGDAEEPRIVYLLNRFLKQKQVNAKTEDFINEPLHKMMVELTEQILDVREQIFKTPKDYSIPVSEQEFVKTMGNTLPLFYLDMVRTKSTSKIDQRLLVNDERIKEIEEYKDEDYLEREKQIEKAKNIKASDRVLTCIKSVF